MNIRTPKRSNRRRVSGLGVALAVPALAAGLGFLNGGTASAASAYQPAVNGGPARLCLDIMSEDGLTTNGARAQLYHCTGASEQQLYALAQNAVAGGTATFLSPESDPTMCLVPAGYSAFNGLPVTNGIGAQVVQEPCNGSTGQVWIHLTATGEFQNYDYGSCLDTTGAGTKDREKVMVAPCNAGATQRWTW